MYLMYVDESGNPNYNDGLDYYDLTGIVVNEKDWVLVDNALTKLKLDFFPNIQPEDIELHAKEIRNKQGIFCHLSDDKIKELFLNFFDSLSTLPIKILSVIVNKKEIMKKQIKFNPISDKTWECLLERFDMLIGNGNEGDKKEFGLAIIDSEGERFDKELREKIRKIVRTGTSFHNFRYIIEDALFTYSHWRNLTQIADLVSYCIVKNKQSNELFMNCFKKIENKFYSNNNGIYKGYGLKVIPRDIEKIV